MRCSRSCARAIFRGLADHEMGHTLGLRHNFAGSTDALNYQRRLLADPRGRRPATPLSEQRAKKKLAEYQYAIGDGLRRALQQRRPRPRQVRQRGDPLRLRPAHRPDAERPRSYDNKLRNDIFLYDYTKLPQAWAGSTRSSPPTTPVIPYYRYRDLLVGTNHARAGTSPPARAALQVLLGRLRGEPRLQDLGPRRQPDARSSTHVQQMYRNYYIFNAYKRGRTDLAGRRLPEPDREPLLQPLLGGVRVLLLPGRRFTDPTTTIRRPRRRGTRVWGSPTIGDDLLMASMSGLNALGAVLQTPEPGPTAPFRRSRTSWSRSSTRRPACPGQTLPPTRPAGRQAVLHLAVRRLLLPDHAGGLALRQDRGAVHPDQHRVALLPGRPTPTSTAARRSTSTAGSSDEMLNLLSGVIRNDSAKYGGDHRRTAPTSRSPVVDPRTFGTLGATPTRSGDRWWSPPRSTRRSATGRCLRRLARLGSTWDATLDFQNFLVVSVKGSSDDQAWGSNITVKEYAHPVTGVIYRAPVYPGAGTSAPGSSTS